MNHLQRITYLLLACIGLSLIAASCRSGAVDLRFNFKPGDKFLYTTRIDQKIESMLTMDQSMVMEMIYTCTGDEGGQKKLKVTYDHIALNTSSAMGSTQYDSKSRQPHESELDVMDSLIGKSFTVAVAPDGAIKVEGMKELTHAAGDQASGPFSDTAMKMMMQGSFDIYPGRKVKVGETWVKKSQMGFSVIKVDVENTYTLKSADGGKAVIDVSAVLTLPKDGTTPAGPMQMTGTQKGTLEVDIATGQIISGKTRQDIKASIPVEGLGRTVPLNITGDITMSSKKL